ncbi:MULTISPECIES: helix-turn-helix domain-containing protein [Thermoactinomyces]|jgi:XRE family transcriptional regulator, regulator of sulfur utilization|uniref:Helix-turn-helix transcriptional regulator n=1 Tax=Thermoactinomyces daqus TaxID=1329516 RepID=A0A7W2AJF6_9BACL|nr:MULTISPECIES: XRE family transcriptional regulator [Thermoactinomyces]MBA4544320.1 helix-turn-helix transcriptional regulator [Thermoactinomyces daqus]MBH8599406.1 helix-turn-helix transcriptional regulator [Thermoactinomyces sp. CICC 10523]MBH8605190.1 helix-turn-helix transcriptional regulator [Thermoactinomyces sp. CICC 10522]MBH8608273.1 helix-turn-helix transcriptional regulator [Thermoactinomyces sp. CICC 10521]
MDIESPWEEGSVGKRIGANLRQLRINRGISLEALAKQINVSKLTLIKIERGEGNPTLSVIWKIANGLNIPITALLSIEADVSIARKKDGLKLSSSNEVFVAEPLFSSYGSFELYRGYLQPGGEYLSEAHRPGVMEFVTVMSGRLTVEVDRETYCLDEYDSIRFKGDRPHKYINPSSALTILHFVISYTHP